MAADQAPLHGGSLTIADTHCAASKWRTGLWQRRFWEHTIRDSGDFERHVDYIHFNPVKHRLVSRVRDWPFSSFHRFVREGLLPEDWAGELSQDHAGFGERRS